MILKATTYFKEKRQLFLALSAWALVAFGQPSWVPLLGVFSACVGFALFWRSLYQINSRKKRFYTSLIWFMAVEAVHLSWMTATEYQGNYIYLLYLLILIAQGAQFGLLTLFVTEEKAPSYSRIFAAAGLWTIIEWLRLFFMSGFPFNPVGLALSSTLIGKQFASVGGIYFLSFWVIMTNLLVLRAISAERSLKSWFTLALVALTPYVYGTCHLAIHHKRMENHPDHLNAILVQTALNPEEKTGMKGFDRMMPPLQQWSAIFNYLAPYKKGRADVIVLPERTVPFADQTPLFPREHLEAVVRHFFGEPALVLIDQIMGDEEMATNVTVSQFLAEYFQAQVIVGLEYLADYSQNDFTAYASAFSFCPSKEPEMYHKRVLLPIVEYLPFQWCVDLAKRYNIMGWYQKGKDPKVFASSLGIAPSICIEELYGALIRKNRLLGAKAFVNITNDVWFPNSNLPRQHFDHGVLRAVENGVPILRSCNTGVTVAVDALGRVVKNFHTHSKVSQWKRGAMLAKLSKYNYKTLYVLWGDSFVLTLSIISLALFASIELIRSKKTPQSDIIAS